MQAGTGLTAVDRLPWLRAVRTAIGQVDGRGASAVVACSALTSEYRAMLRADLESARFVYLRADPELLDERLRKRQGHFAGAALLPSQLATLERPGQEALDVDAGLPVEDIIAAIRREWNL
jgi:gluconokinase